MIKLPIITTKRLCLRPIKRSDAKAIYAYAKLKGVGPAAGWSPHKSIKDSERFIRYMLNKQKKGQPGAWVICMRDEDEPLGTIEIHSFAGYKGEIGFVLHPDYWNQGYITEAAEAVMLYAFSRLNMMRLEYAHFLDNDASRRVREKLGFEVEGVKRMAFRHEDGRVLDEVLASYTREDYKREKQSRFAPLEISIRIENP